MRLKWIALIGSVVVGVILIIQMTKGARDLLNTYEDSCTPGGNRGCRSVIVCELLLFTGLRGAALR